MVLVISYLVIINAASLLLMHADKKKAQRGAWRIPEATLLTVAALGGSLGGLIGMQAFRHKTRHLRFAVGLPLLLFAHCALLMLLLKAI